MTLMWAILLFALGFSAGLNADKRFVLRRRELEEDLNKEIIRRLDAETHALVLRGQLRRAAAPPGGSYRSTDLTKRVVCAEDEA